MQSRWCILVPAWLIALLLVLSPGIAHFLWLQEIASRPAYWQSANVVLPGYFVGNLLAIAILGISFWYLGRFEMARIVLAICSVITLTAIVIGLKEMGWYIGEFVAG